MPQYPTPPIKEKLFPDKLAPSGFITINKYIPPFTPNTTGFGYLGVVSTDSKEGTIQCSECGKFFQQIGFHLKMKHGMTGKEYREKFGLLMTTALKSKRIRLIQSKTISDLVKQGKMNIGNKPNKNGKSYGFKPNNPEAANRKGIKKAEEAKNKYGRCDEQIKDAIMKLKEKLGKTPTLTNIKDEYGGGIVSIMHQRYGSYIKYCRKNLKLTPNFSTKNPKFPTKTSWRNHLITLGRQARRDGRPETIKKFLEPNESRYIYRFFKNFKDYLKHL